MRRAESRFYLFWLVRSVIEYIHLFFCSFWGGRWTSLDHVLLPWILSCIREVWVVDLGCKRGMAALEEGRERRVYI